MLQQLHFQFQWSKDPLLATLVFIIHKFCTLMEPLICNLKLRNSSNNLIIFITKKNSLRLDSKRLPETCVLFIYSSFSRPVASWSFALSAGSHKGYFPLKQTSLNVELYFFYILFPYFCLLFMSARSDKTFIQLEHPNDKIW